MSDNNTATASGGVGCLSLLGILFVALKLLDKIDWDWIWVLAPFWIQAVIVVIILGIIVVLAIVID
ncbi:MAG: hypothetical protein KAS38_14080 [Anaerolineales bacterium]|nr:hypothetical protein [Anaerolineales bacterium]